MNFLETFFVSAKSEARKFSAPKRANKIKLDPLEKLTKKTNNVMTSDEPKRVRAPIRSPFSLAFGSANSDDDSDQENDDFRDTTTDIKQTAEETWDQMITTFDKEPKTEKKTVKLGALVKRKKKIQETKDKLESNQENKSDPYDEPESYDEFNADLNKRNHPKPKTPPPPTTTTTTETKMTNNPTQPSKARPKRFFKGRTQEAKEQILQNFTLREDKPNENVFKKPIIPTNQPNNPDSADLRVPEATRLTDDQLGDKEHADDLRHGFIITLDLLY